MKTIGGVSANAEFNAVPIRIHVADTNRLRWVLYALRTNDKLGLLLEGARASVNQGILILDSLVLGNYSRLPELPCFVVMWDGYVSHLEIRHTHFSLMKEAQDRCTLLVVGQLKDTLRALPDRTANLFPEAPSALRSTKFVAPWSASLGHSIKSWLRPLKNTLASPKRSSRLLGRRHIVFCGSVRPTLSAIGSLLSDIPKDVRIPIEVAIAGAPHIKELSGSKRYGERVYNAIAMLDFKNCTEAALAYTLSSLLHRHLTLSYLSESGRNLFVSEYGFDPHIDPYDAQAYSRHLYVDFGSTRGPERLYPRTADLEATRKTYKALRFLDTERSIEDYFLSTNYKTFGETAYSHAQVTIEQFSRSRELNELGDDVKAS